MGLIFLTIAVIPSHQSRAPFSPAALYLLVGVLLSPAVFGLAELDIRSHHKMVEILAKIAVTISLFIDGLKMDSPFTWKKWKNPLLLGGPVMIGCILLVAAAGVWIFKLPWGLAILLGAILAPTDPVLASAVSLKDYEDDDDIRFSLSGEAGFNDGTAFPFVILGLSMLEPHESESWLVWWAAHRLLWAVPVGLLVGYFLGFFLSSRAFKMRSKHTTDCAPNDFLAVGLVAVSYCLAETVGAWGFLAAFACGIGMREEALRRARQTEDSNQDGVEPHDKVIQDIFKFGKTAERLLELALVFVVGLSLTQYFEIRALWLCALLFLVFRPILVQLFLARTARSGKERVLISWFGIKGIGSLYYLCYALSHTQLDGMAKITEIVVSVVAVSILCHTLSVGPIGAILDRNAGK